MAMYSKVSYWDKRYLSTSEDGPCEWYQGYQSLRHLLNPIHFAAQQQSLATASGSSLLSPQNFHLLASTATSTSSSKQQQQQASVFPSRENCRVLILGCGNSTFGEDMQRDGWSGPIINADFSKVVIDQMKAKYGVAFYENWNKKGGAANNRRGGGYSSSANPPTPMDFICADMTQTLPFGDNSFDLVVCKGSFDAVLCSGASRFNIVKVVEECVRLLAPGHGIFFLVTHGNPDSRIEYLEHENDLKYYWFDVSYRNVPRPVTLNSNSRKRFVQLQKQAQITESTASGVENESNELEESQQGRAHATTVSKNPPPLSLDVVAVDQQNEI